MQDFNQYVFNLIKSPVDNRDFLLESIYPEKVELPKTWDMRPLLFPIKNQGTQGTCSAQTAACIKEYQEKLDVGLSEALSPQFVYNLRPNQGSSGMESHLPHCYSGFGQREKPFSTGVGHR